MKRGDIRWYRFAPPDKNRPVIILTRDSIIGYLNEVTVAPLTSTIRGIPTEVVLSKQDGVPKECAVNCDHIQTVAKSKLGEIITTISGGRMNEVRKATMFALDL